MRIVVRPGTFAAGAGGVPHPIPMGFLYKRPSPMTRLTSRAASAGSGWGPTVIAAAGAGGAGVTTAAAWAWHLPHPASLGSRGVAFPAAG